MRDDWVWNQVLVLHGRIEGELARSLQRQHGLGVSEYRALSRLAEADGGILRIQELASAIGLNQSSVSRLVGRLESAGLTERELCAEDRRGVYSAITARGRARYAAAKPSYDAALEAALTAASSDPDLRLAATAIREMRAPQ